MSRKRFAAISVACLLLAVLTQAVCAVKFSEIDRDMPRCAELRGVRGVTMAQASESFEALRISRFGAQSDPYRLPVMLGDKVTDALVVYATPKLGGILPIEFYSGGWMSGDGQAVLSKGVAELLLPGAAPEGSDIAIGGKMYSVAGVHAESDMQAVFISDRGTDVPVASVFLADREGEEGEHGMSLLQRASESTVLALDGEMHDYRELAALAQSLWYLSAVLCALIALVLILSASSRIVFAIVFARERAMRGRVLFIGLAATMSAAALIGFSFLMRGLKIPGAFLPPDNIFDFSFYGWEIIKFVARSQEHVYEARALASIAPLALAGAASAASFCAGTVLIYRRIKTRIAAIH
ncbi:MAG: ABC transporter permease [Oscillospiraceae bacterium]|jgi:hypothetical protein|nr:ABC transporter permease [Oscillospiraceae bacterium]